MKRVQYISTPLGFLRCFRGARARRWITKLFGLGRAFPGPLKDEIEGPISVFKTNRLLFVDDETGEPKCLWLP